MDRVPVLGFKFEKELQYLRKVDDFKEKEDRKAFKIFFATCNLNCGYCKRTKEGSPEEVEFYTKKELLDMTEKYSDLGRIIECSGGEVTTQADTAAEILKYAKLKSSTTAIATNGLRPSDVRTLAKYVDTAKVDVKGPERYVREVVNASYDLEKVMQTVEILASETLLNIKFPVFKRTEWKDIGKNLGRIRERIPLKEDIFFTVRPYKEVEWAPSNIQEPDIDKCKRLAERLSESASPANIMLKYNLTSGDHGVEKIEFFRGGARV